jgi:thiamine pyrophosphokinase
MNALLVAAAPSSGSRELVASLAREHDLIIAVDGGGTLCAEAGVVPDALIGDLDSIADRDRKLLQDGGSEVLTFPADKDQTDLELAIAHARALGATSLTVTAASGLRLDHTLGSLSAIVAAFNLHPRLVEPTVEAWVLHPEGRASLSLSGQGGTLSLVCWGGPCEITADGLKWPLEHATLHPQSALGVSNVIDSPQADLHIHAGAALAIAPAMPGGVRVWAL